MAEARPTPRIAYEEAAEPELVALARAGHREAFRAIMQRSNQRLFRVARAIVRDEAEAEDVLQEAYLHAFSSFGGFRGEAGVLTWLIRIVVNEARGRLRKRRGAVGVEQLEAVQAQGGEVIMFPTSPAMPNPETDVARAQIRRLLERAVDDLPEAFRVVFILRDVDDCSTEETAAALGVRPETVKTRLHRARRQLRKALDETLGAAMAEAFPFLGVRCQRVTESVIGRLASRYGWN